MSDERENCFTQLRQCRPIPWSLIPDLGLYMDQVVTLVGRVYQPLYGPDIKSFLSPAMINNYVKAKLIPRPVGKKYSREQVALLSMIVPLKQVCSMDDIRALLAPGEGQSVEALYEGFCAHFCRAMEGLRVETGNIGISSAMDFAIRAVSYRAGCSAALESSKTQG